MAFSTATLSSFIAQAELLDKRPSPPSKTSVSQLGPRTPPMPDELPVHRARAAEIVAQFFDDVPVYTPVARPNKHVHPAPMQAAFVDDVTAQPSSAVEATAVQQITTDDPVEIQLPIATRRDRQPTAPLLSAYETLAAMSNVPNVPAAVQLATQASGLGRSPTHANPLPDVAKLLAAVGQSSAARAALAAAAPELQAVLERIRTRGLAPGSATSPGQDKQGNRQHAVEQTDGKGGKSRAGSSSPPSSSARALPLPPATFLLRGQGSKAKAPAPGEDEARQPSSAREKGETGGRRNRSASVENKGSRGSTGRSASATGGQRAAVGSRPPSRPTSPQAQPQQALAKQGKEEAPPSRIPRPRAAVARRGSASLKRDASAEVGDHQPQLVHTHAQARARGESVDAGVQADVEAETAPGMTEVEVTAESDRMESAALSQGSQAEPSAAPSVPPPARSPPARPSPARAAEDRRVSVASIVSRHSVDVDIRLLEEALREAEKEKRRALASLAQAEHLLREHIPVEGQLSDPASLPPSSAVSVAADSEAHRARLWASLMGQGQEQEDTAHGQHTQDEEQPQVQAQAGDAAGSVHVSPSPAYDNAVPVASPGRVDATQSSADGAAPASPEGAGGPAEEVQMALSPALQGSPRQQAAAVADEDLAAPPSPEPEPAEPAAPAVPLDARLRAVERRYIAWRAAQSVRVKEASSAMAALKGAGPGMGGLADMLSSMAQQAREARAQSQPRTQPQQQQQQVGPVESSNDRDRNVAVPVVAHTAAPDNLGLGLISSLSLVDTGPGSPLPLLPAHAQTRSHGFRSASQTTFAPAVGPLPDDDTRGAPYPMPTSPDKPGPTPRKGRAGQRGEAPGVEQRVLPTKQADTATPPASVDGPQVTESEHRLPQLRSSALLSSLQLADEGLMAATASLDSTRHVLPPRARDMSPKAVPRPLLQHSPMRPAEGGLVQTEPRPAEAVEEAEAVPAGEEEDAGRGLGQHETSLTQQAEAGAKDVTSPVRSPAALNRPVLFSPQPAPPMGQAGPGADRPPRHHRAGVLAQVPAKRLASPVRKGGSKPAVGSDTAVTPAAPRGGVPLDLTITGADTRATPVAGHVARTPTTAPGPAIDSGSSTIKAPATAPVLPSTGPSLLLSAAMGETRTRPALTRAPPPASGTRFGTLPSVTPGTSMRDSLASILQPLGMSARLGRM